MVTRNIKLWKKYKWCLKSFLSFSSILSKAGSTFEGLKATSFWGEKAFGGSFLSSSSSSISSVRNTVTISYIFLIMSTLHIDTSSFKNPRNKWSNFNAIHSDPISITFSNSWNEAAIIIQSLDSLLLASLR